MCLRLLLLTLAIISIQSASILNSTAATYNTSFRLKHQQSNGTLLAGTHDIAAEVSQYLETPQSVANWKNTCKLNCFNLEIHKDLLHRMIVSKLQLFITPQQLETMERWKNERIQAITQNKDYYNETIQKVTTKYRTLYIKSLQSMLFNLHHIASKLLRYEPCLELNAMELTSLFWFSSKDQTWLKHFMQLQYFLNTKIHSTIVYRFPSSIPISLSFHFNLSLSIYQTWVHIGLYLKQQWQNLIVSKLHQYFTNHTMKTPDTQEQNEWIENDDSDESELEILFSQCIMSHKQGQDTIEKILLGISNYQFPFMFSKDETYSLKSNATEIHSLVTLLNNPRYLSDFRQAVGESIFQNCRVFLTLSVEQIGIDLTLFDDLIHSAWQTCDGF